MAHGSHVLVGYDATRESERALRWAAEEARLRGLPLRVCHAWRWPYPVGYVDHECMARVRRIGEHILDRGVALAGDVAPTVRTQRQLVDGPADAALTHHAHGAELIVVGSREGGDVSAGSIALRLPARARRPVVVVRATGTRSGEVVVGVDGSAAGDAALALAFEEAELRGWRVRAVYGCWEPGAARDCDLGLFNDREKLRRICRERLDRAVAPWRARHPRVEAETALVVEPPRQALFAAAETADLVVVGNRGTGGLEPSELGTTSTALLRQVPCTVAVVQAGGWFAEY
ncbi:universal stress protein [Actinomadura sp. NBRC 104425]|uniref:universal stress protein n=1 Tax=Actinomadura sp. NBRC 104425 TaxID=3032204 RepID=UPI0024A3F499|nr:universal stress protein [Actinomadura sp. NBRC 104425]GLZ12916.1 universal stress protein [Actinomadura sp. NBRC 104425]